jgi:hypothetical protein
MRPTRFALSLNSSGTAIDGEARTVTVHLERDAMDAVSAVRIEDDGHGISSDEVEATFGRIGDSWKRHSTRTRNGLRAVHGNLGEGRLRAFALGSRVVWASRSVNTAGEWQDVTITGSRGGEILKFGYRVSASGVPSRVPRRARRLCECPRNAPPGSWWRTTWSGRDRRPPTARGTSRGRLPACSTSVSARPGRRAIKSQSVGLSANFLRSERRSDDGQTILKVA